MRPLSPCVFGIALVVVACGGGSVARQYVGPDGSRDWWHLRGHDRGELLQMAGQRCPYGYSIVDEKDGMSLRCKGPSAPAPTVSPECAIEYHQGKCAEEWARVRTWNTEAPAYAPPK